MQVVQNAMSSVRKMRSPMHPFYVSHLPYHIVPFCIAPVLPGETLTHAMIQSRAVTDPIKSPLMGWWLEHYFFYVKLTDLYEREKFREMLLNPSYNVSSITALQTQTTALRGNFFAGGTGMIDYVDFCYRRVVDEYFRDEDETYLDHRFIDVASTGRTYSLAKIVGESWFDSVALKDDSTAVDVTLIDAATSDVLTASEVDAGMRLWQQQRLYGVTELSYEDWLATFGVKVPEADPHRPELLRYLREWQYPTNTIDPTNGTPRSAVSWSVRDRLDKARYFNEPGFIFGVTLVRPKVYVRDQEGSASCLLNDWKAWAPAIFSGDPNISRKDVSTSAGPLQTVVSDADGYSVDLADLMLYGEHFTNELRTSTAVNMMDCVSADLTNVLYPTALSDIDELFVTSGTNNCRQDGIVSFNIKMNASNPVIDFSPRGGNRSGETSGGF